MISRELRKLPCCLLFGLRKATPRHVGKAEDTASAVLPGRRTLLWQAGQGIGVNDYSLTLSLSNGPPCICSTLGFCNVRVYYLSAEVKSSADPLDLFQFEGVGDSVSDCLIPKSGLLFNHWNTDALFVSSDNL